MPLFCIFISISDIPIYTPQTIVPSIYSQIFMVNLQISIALGQVCLVFLLENNLQQEDISLLFDYPINLASNLIGKVEN